MYKLVFILAPEEVATLDTFLTERLKPEFGHRIGHGGRIIIDDLEGKDIAWRIGEWVRHNSPVEKIRYTIVGYTEDLKVEYLSYCPLCREGKGPHYEHEKKVKGNKK